MLDMRCKHSEFGSGWWTKTLGKTYSHWVCLMGRRGMGEGWLLMMERQGKRKKESEEIPGDDALLHLL